MSDENLANIINNSGFLFQLAVENEIRKNYDSHGWEVISHEYGWHNLNHNKRGFVDLLISRGIVRLVIECKRRKNAQWVFLMPNKNNNGTLRARCQWIYTNSNIENIKNAGWDDFKVEPYSAESEFCVIRGQGENDKPLLEKIGSELIDVTEAIAEEEIKLLHSKFQDKGIFIPIIITNADLHLCHFKLDEISTKDGILESKQFEKIEMIRFRKSLSQTAIDLDKISDLRGANMMRERTIFVINIEYFLSFLKNFSLDKIDPWTSFPWQTK